MPSLFDHLTLRGVTLRNRIGVSPMVQTSSVDGFASDWHLVHLGARAVGGAGLVMTEATAVEAQGRISISDLGLWKDEHIDKLRDIATFIKAEGAVAGIQLAHGGRKSSYRPPFNSEGVCELSHLTREQGAWEVIGPSAIPFDDNSPMPREMTTTDIDRVVEKYADAAQRAVTAGFDWIEVHAAHGYLPHAFYSPIANQRSDDYGGSFENRVRFIRRIAKQLRKVIPDSTVLSFRISYTDWVEGGWTLEDSVRLAALLKDDGVDLIDVSSGGNTAKTVALMRQLRHKDVGRQHGTKDPVAEIPLGPGYQVPGAHAIREQVGIPVAAVGLITEAQQADEIITTEKADLIFLARSMLRDPNWPVQAAISLDQTNRLRIPVQYYLAWKDYGEFSYQPVSAPLVE